MMIIYDSGAELGLPRESQTGDIASGVAGRFAPFSPSGYGKHRVYPNEPRRGGLVGSAPSLNGVRCDRT